MLFYVSPRFFVSVFERVRLRTHPLRRMLYVRLSFILSRKSLRFVAIAFPLQRFLTVRTSSCSVSCPAWLASTVVPFRILLTVLKTIENES